MSVVKRAFGKARRVVGLLAQGSYGKASRLVVENLWSESLAYGLVFDRRSAIEQPQARLALSVRPLQARDVPLLLTDEESPIQIAGLRKLLDAEIPTAMVAVDDSDVPYFMQWLIYPADQPRLTAAFGPEFPPLGPGEALVEGAFTPTRSRGLRVGPSAVWLIASGATGADRVWTYVNVDNAAALAAASRVGFVPKRLRRSKWRLLRQTVTIEPMTDAYLAARGLAVGG